MSEISWSVRPLEDARGSPPRLHKVISVMYLRTRAPFAQRTSTITFAIDVDRSTGELADTPLELAHVLERYRRREPEPFIVEGVQSIRSGRGLGWSPAARSLSRWNPIRTCFGRHLWPGTARHFGHGSASSAALRGSCRHDTTSSPRSSRRGSLSRGGPRTRRPSRRTGTDPSR